jgi:hypothetical protein
VIRPGETLAESSKAQAGTHPEMGSAPPGVFALHLLQHARVAVLYTANHKLVEMIILPPHHPLQDVVQPCQCRIAGDLYSSQIGGLHPVRVILI